MSTLLGIRGTDVALAALKCSEIFDTGEITDAYHSVRTARSDPLNQHWQAGIRNEMQRLSSDCQQFGGIDLFAFRGKGVYSFRDGLRHQLIEAANTLAQPFNARLWVPQDKIVLQETATNHLVGAWAQTKIMQTMVQRGYEIIDDTSRRCAYDFLFRQPGRKEIPQTMECKGTCTDRHDVSLTENELQVLAKNYYSHWLGFVCGIQIADGQPQGGSEPFITEPPVLEKWQFARAVRLHPSPAALALAV